MFFGVRDYHHHHQYHQQHQQILCYYIEVCVCKCLCTCMWRPEVNLWCPSLEDTNLVYLKQCLSLHLKLTHDLRLAGQPWRSASLHLPSTRLTNVDHHTQLLVQVLGLELGASRLCSEPSPQPSVLTLCFCAPVSSARSGEHFFIIS